MCKAVMRHRGNCAAGSPASRQCGFTLIELLIVMLGFVIVITATTNILLATASTQKRDQSYAQEVASAQGALARLVRDLRQATTFPVPVLPGVIEFQEQVGTTTYNVKYDCTATDSLGLPYRRCARTQAVAPATPPAAGATPGPDDIQHVWNNPGNTSDISAGHDYSSFCTTTGSAASGSVFFVSNPNTANTDGSTFACDETYEQIVSQAPDYVQVRIDVPAAGDQVTAGLRHMIVLQDGTYLPNLDSGA
jgi:prepilin-type N-terminal cleavage/methylation domain-containing protein